MLIDWIAAAIGAATSIAGGLFGSSRQRSETERARDWNAQQYAQRYQVTMADMRRAGLNPMLAYSQGPGTAPTSQPADQSAISSGFSSAGQLMAQANIRNAQAGQARTQAAVNKASAKQIAMDTRLKSAQIDKVHAETATEFQRAIQSGAAAELDYQKIRQSKAEVERLKKVTGLTDVQVKQGLVDLERMTKTGKGHLADFTWTVSRLVKALLGIELPSFLRSN